MKIEIINTKINGKPYGAIVKSSDGKINFLIYSDNEIEAIKKCCDTIKAILSNHQTGSSNTSQHTLPSPEQ